MLQILLAGRDEYVTGFLCRIIRFRVPQIVSLCTGSGAEALEMLAGGGFSAGIVEQDLSDLCGMEIIRRARWRGMDMPLVLLAGESTRDLAIRAQQVGAQDLLEKPVTVQRIEAVIRDFVLVGRSGSGR